MGRGQTFDRFPPSDRGERVLYKKKTPKDPPNALEEQKPKGLLMGPPPGLESGTYELSRKDLEESKLDFEPPGLEPKQDFFSAFQQSSSLFSAPLFNDNSSGGFGSLFERKPTP